MNEFVDLYYLSFRFIICFWNYLFLDSPTNWVPLVFVCYRYR